MKKIVLSLLGTIIVSGIIGGNVFFNSHTTLDQKQKNDEIKIIEQKPGSDSEKISEKEETKMSEQKEKEEKTEQVSNNDSEKEKTQPKKDATNNSSSASKNEVKQNTNSNNTTSSSQSQPKKEITTTQPSNNNQNNSQDNSNCQKNIVSTTFYDSITGGKREFSSESAAFARGTEIQNKELDYVLDWNEAHPDNQIQPDINYFRVYPSAIDENGNYWYYLHFFCQSGEGNDAKLKSRY